MGKDELFKNGADMIYLATCALHEKQPDKEIIGRMNLPEVYKQAARHSMHAITYMALTSSLSETELKALNNELFEQWKQSYLKAIRKLVLFDIEREKIFSFFKRERIWYMPLKGVLLQCYYPKLGMRQMSDNDILFDSERRKDLRDFMIQNGYEVYKYNTGHPDTYFKPPLNFEMHHSLYENIESRRQFSDYYCNVKERLLLVDNESFAYRFTDEDMYIYITAHAYKHVLNGGNGIRSLMDTYVFLSNSKTELNDRYIKTELKKLGIHDFERRTSSLAQRIFSEKCINLNTENNVISSEEKELLLFYIQSGTFGTREQNMTDNLAKYSVGSKVTFWSKVKYCFSRLFPNMDYYRLNYPRVYKTKILIPFIWLYRLFSQITSKRKLLLQELKLLKKLK